MNEYLAVDISGSVCMSIVRSLIASWLNGFRRSRDGVRFDSSTGEWKEAALGVPRDEILCSIATYNCSFSFNKYLIHSYK